MGDLMTAPQFRKRQLNGVIYALLFAVFLSSCAAKDMKHHDKNEEFKMIREYVWSKYNWKPNEYRIERTKNANSDGIRHNVLVEFSIIYLADEIDWKLGKFGNGKSFALIVDVEKEKIIKQLVFQ